MGENNLNPKKVGLCLGLVVAAMHLLWSLVVAVGLGPLFLHWVYRLHFLSNPFIVEAFNPVKAILLIAGSFVGGCVLGGLFAWTWNKLGERLDAKK